MLDETFGEPCWPPGVRAVLELLDDLAQTSTVGGACLDALVATASASDGRTLLTRDHRAERTHRALGVTYELVA